MVGIYQIVIAKQTHLEPARMKDAGIVVRHSRGYIVNPRLQKSFGRIGHQVTPGCMYAELDKINSF